MTTNTISTLPMPADSIAEQKAWLRASVLKQRAGPHANGATAAAMAIAGIAADLVSRHRPRVVSAYVPMRDEIDCLPALDRIAASGVVTAVPVVVGKARPLVFRRWRPGEPLQAAAFGVSVPPDSAPEVVPDLLLVPLAAFDRDGYRLGYGGGFYDRTLEKLRAGGTVFAYGLAYDEQQIERVPCEPFDQRLDGIVTPSGLIITVGHS